MKTRVKLIALVLLMAIATTAILCACNTDASLLKRNDERYSKQITATATYGDRISVVDVNELYTSFYRYYSYIYQYYSYGYITADQFKNFMSDLDKTFADSNESLARNAMYVLQHIDALYNEGLKSSNAELVNKMKAASTVNKTYDFSKMDQLENYYVDRSAEIKAILDVVSADKGYVNAAIYFANNQLSSLFDKYCEEVRSEKQALNREKDTTPDGYTDIEIVSKPNRLIYEVDSNAEINLAGMQVVAKYSDGKTVVVPNKYLTVTGFDASKAKEDQEITVTYGGFTQKFNVTIVTALTDRTKDADEEKSDSEKIKELTNDNQDYLEIKNEEYYKNKGYLTDDMSEDEIKTANTAAKRTLDYLEKNFRSYNYYLYVGYNEQIGNCNTQRIIQSVRITEQELNSKYDELVTKALNAYKDAKYEKSTIEGAPFETIVHKNYSDESFGYYYVSHVLFQFDDDTKAKIDEFKNEKVANDDVIAEFAKSLISEITVWESNVDFDKTATCEKEDCNCARCSNYNGKSVTFDTLAKWYGLDEKFDDPCVSFENGERTVTCKCAACPTNKYVGVKNAMEVVAELQQAIADCGDDLAKKNEVMAEYIYKYNMDPGMFTNIKKDLGYLMTPADIDSGMVKDYEEKCEELAAQGVGSYGWVASSDYGVFFIMVTGKVADLADENVTEIAGTDYVKLGLNYVTNAAQEKEDGENPVVVTANGEVELTVGSIGYYIWKDLIEEAQSIELARIQKAFFDKYAEDGLEYFPKAYKDLIKSVEKGNA